MIRIAMGKTWAGFAVAVLGLLALGMFMPQSAAAEACADKGFGSASTTTNIPVTGTYKVWARIKAAEADVNANSFQLEIDNNTCFAMGGGSGISQSNWTWVSFQGGNPASIVTHNFATTGDHSIRMVGNEASVKLDRVIFTQDMGCTPTDKGDNCANPPDSTPPTVSLTAPASGATVQGQQVTVSANATDTESGITNVAFYYGSTLIGQDNTAPYSVTWDASNLQNGTYNLTARATNGQGAVATSANRTVTVANPVQFSCAASTILICEDFTAGLTTALSFTGGEWLATGGKLILSEPTTSNTTVGNLNTAVHAQNVTGDYDLSVDGEVVPSSTNFDDFSVIFGYQNDSNYYFVSLNESNDGNTQGVFKVANGAQTELTDITGTIQAGTAYDVQVKRRGSTYEVFVNDQKVATTTDGTFTSGKVGVGTRNNEVKFDNLTVTAVQTQPTGDTTAPSVSITSPANNSSTSGTITVAANATDNVGVTKVEFYIDNQLKSVDTTAPYSLSLDSLTLTGGNHTLTAKAFDAAGNSKLSSGVVIQVNNVVAKPEDINGDGKVNLLDFSLLASKFGQTGSSLGDADINEDGKVNLLDFSLLASKFGQ